MARRREDRGRDDANGHATHGDDATRMEAYRRGQPKDWPAEPAFREYQDGRFRVDYDWLCARLADMAAAKRVKLAAHALAPYLAEVRLERARQAREAAIAEGHEPPEDKDSPLSKTPKQLKSSSSSVINDIAQRRRRPSQGTIDDLAALAARLKLPDSNPVEWARRGGCVAWATPPVRWGAQDRYAGWGDIMADFWRQQGTPEEEWRGDHASIRARAEAKEEAKRRAEQEGRKDRTQPGHANGTTGAPE